MTVAIAIRDETSEALQTLMKNANNVQDDVEASLSDVIDALLQLTDKIRDEAMLGEIQAVAAVN